eukprot:5925731-Pyramimonas_sp.AAC.1
MIPTLHRTKKKEHKRNCVNATYHQYHNTTTGTHLYAGTQHRTQHAQINGTQRTQHANQPIRERHNFARAKP